MLPHLGPLHAIAAQRGDGLRPELVRLLERDANDDSTASGEPKMSREEDNKALVGRWFGGFWGNPWNPQIIDELAAPDMLLQYSLHAPRRGREEVFNDFLAGSLPASSGRKMHFTGTTVLRVENGKIAEEVGLDDGVAALTQLGILKAA